MEDPEEFGCRNMSVVDILGEYTSSCGYCEGGSGSVSFGLLSKRLQPQDYQDLIDRGWRRCGYMCYKPIMNRTCCPQYTIRCCAPEFKLSKSQKKVLKKMSTFLRSDLTLLDKKQKSSVSMAEEGTSTKMLHKELKELVQHKIVGPMGSSDRIELGRADKINLDTKEECTDTTPDSSELNSSSQERQSSLISIVASPYRVTRPDGQVEFPRKKAKLIRLENKRSRLNKERPLSHDSSKGQSEKTLEEHLAVNESAETTQNLELKLSLSAALSVEQCREEWELYKKYQITVHHDSENECEYDGFIEFLVSSPLQNCSPEGSPSFGYGSFHQQYRLNGKLIAVGVLDILPYCVSSVYFFYDPDYSHLSLGTYASLREIAFTRSLSAYCAQLRFYYLGYYIHTCEKMRYKKNYSPSFLLCPELFTWQPVCQCLPKIDANKYSRLDDTSTSSDENINYDKVLCWVSFLNKLMTFQMYQCTSQITALYAPLAAAAKQEIDEYAQYVGRKCAESMIVVI